MLALHLVLGGVAVGCLVFALGQWRARHREADMLDSVLRATRRIAGGEPQLHAPLMPGPAGELARAVNTIAEQLRKERAEAAPARVFEQAMVRETPNGLLVVDREGRIRTLNPAARRLLPWQGDPVGQLVVEAVPVIELVEALEEAANTGVPAETSARVGQRELLLRGLPLVEGEGTLGVVLDITSVRNAERSRRDFVANVSHELRTPITALVGYSESLLDEDLPEHVRPMLEAVGRNSRRLHRLAEDVLQLSRIEARASDLPTRREPLLPAIEDVIARIGPTAIARGVTLAVECPEDLAATINAEAFEQALANLVDNGVKYARSGGSVTVRASAGAGHVDVAVADDGPGIDEAHHARIFERFYRVDPGRSRDVGGTGLGLAIVKHFCLAMGAEVFFTSRPGAGSTFTLRLPPA